MAVDLAGTFVALKSILAKHAKRLRVKTDTPTEYILTTKSPSPFPQHEGQPLDFGYVRLGKKYASIHLLALYMSPTPISTELKKRMQGKTCFNFTAAPPPEAIAELERLAEAGLKRWAENK